MISVHISSALQWINMWLIPVVILCMTSQTISRTISPLIIDEIPDNSRTLDDAENINLAIKLNELDCAEDLKVEKEYILFQNGSLLLPERKHLYNYSTFAIENDTAYICVEEDNIRALERVQSPTIGYNLTKEFFVCGHILIHKHKFKLYDNGTVFIEMYNKYYGPGNYLLHERGVYVCLPDFENMMKNVTDGSVRGRLKFSMAFVHVTRIGIALSVLCLIAHLLVFCMIPTVKNLPGCCLASLSLSLLMAYLFFILSSLQGIHNFCEAFGICMYYFFLTSFFWMNIISFDVWRSFRAVTRNLRISSHRVPYRRFAVYSTYCWITPSILACVAHTADTTDYFPVEFRPSFGSPICWFSNRKALLVFFAVPLFIIMGLNAIFFIDSAYVINVATMKTKQPNDAMLKRRFFMFMRLAVLMGLTWIIGIVAGYVGYSFLWYLFVILNTLQGFFIFVVFTCSSKVRAVILKKIKGSKKRQSTSVRTISQASGAL